MRFGRPAAWAARFIVAGLALLAFAASAPSARALPSFARETQQPCSKCHVGAFGPQLKQNARDFKLFGYTQGIGPQELKEISLVIQGSFTHTNAPQDPPPSPSYGRNNNFAIDEVSAFFGGKLVGGAGAFAELSYDAVEGKASIGQIDVRRAQQFDLGAHDLVAGIDLNDNPGVQDLWNTTPAWRFPFNGSPLAPTPGAAALIDGGLEQKVLGVGLYAMLDDTLYLEATGYRQLNRPTLRFLGVGSENGDDILGGAAAYWRVALQHNFHDRHYLQIGAYGLSGHVYPGGDQSAGADHYRDVGVDSTYQYTASEDHYVSAHATYLNEDATLDASSALIGLRRRQRLQTARADVSYSYKNTWTPTVQLFRTWGTPDPLRYANGSPDSSGVVAEVAYTPYGKVSSSQWWWNMRWAVQYVAYREFDGLKRGASANNTLFLSLWVAMSPLGRKDPPAR